MGDTHPRAYEYDHGCYCHQSSVADKVQEMQRLRRLVSSIADLRFESQVQALVNDNDDNRFGPIASAFLWHEQCLRAARSFGLECYLHIRNTQQCPILLARSSVKKKGRPAPSSVVSKLVGNVLMPSIPRDRKPQDMLNI